MEEKIWVYITGFWTSRKLQNCPCRLLLPPFSLLPAYGVTPYAGAATWPPTRRSPTQTALERPRFAPWPSPLAARERGTRPHRRPCVTRRRRRRAARHLAVAFPGQAFPRTLRPSSPSPSSLSYLRHCSPPRARLERPSHHCHGYRCNTLIQISVFNNKFNWLYLNF